MNDAETVALASIKAFAAAGTVFVHPDVGNSTLTSRREMLAILASATVCVHTVNAEYTVTGTDIDGVTMNVRVRIEADHIIIEGMGEQR